MAAGERERYILLDDSIAVRYTAQMRSLASWTTPEINRECGGAYSVYSREQALHYTTYFDAHVELRGSHPYCARDLCGALPPQSNWLESQLPPGRRHLHFRSGKSSQVLALALLCSAAQGDPEHQWLAELLGWSLGGCIRTDFEHELTPDLLKEQDSPKRTSIDYFVESDELVICVECKWTERGLGACSCGKRDDDADPSVGECSERVRKRDRYWEVARNTFGLPERQFGEYCPISTAYQAVRNVAAASVLAAGRKAAFVLLYDERNPYFRATNAWPGWPAVLGEALADTLAFRFRSASWQQLVCALPLDSAVRQWAREKHKLPA